MGTWGPEELRIGTGGGRGVGNERGGNGQDKVKGSAE